MSKLTEDMTGKRFGKLVVTNMIYGQGRTRCECKCDCGNVVDVTAWRLKAGKKLSCGCDHNERFPSVNRRDLTGQRFGKLVVKEMIYGVVKSGRKRTYCVCECDCGNTIEAESSSLTTGRKISCGCDTSERRAAKFRKDLTGQKFGRLTVLKMLWEYHPTRCECICDCGNRVVVIATQLTCGKTMSCGCLQRERTSQANEKDWTGVVSPTGIEFIRQDHKNDRGVWLWLCKCGVCGEYFVELPARIMGGAKSSCGCTNRRSFGEIMTENILKDLQINFKTEYTFPDCVNRGVLRFDFAIFDNLGNLLFLIEYDGAQHYMSVPLFGGEEGFEKRKENDRIKDEYCLKNNIDLIRLPYYLTYEEVFNIINNKYQKSVETVTPSMATYTV